MKDIKINWLTQGSFLFEYKGCRILVDPYMSDYLEVKGLVRMQEYPLKLEDLKPDLVICTHDHLDHLDPETIVKIAAQYPGCKFAGPQSCYAHFVKLEVPEEHCILLERNKPLSMESFDILPVYASHSDPDAVGLVFNCGGKKIYLTGDSLFEERLIQDEVREVDLLLVCINGRLGNMPLEDALKLAEKLRPACALPMHYGLFAENTADPVPFVDGCGKLGIKSFEMQTGQEFMI
jgi:L-ascorbate metabolism protein UlaG (beta-lactamase superfamily)